MWSAGVKVMNFQNRTEPIRLFNISNFPSIVKDELAVLQQRAAAQKTAETRITYDTLLCAGLYSIVFNIFQLIFSKYRSVGSYVQFANIITAHFFCKSIVILL